MIKKLTTTILIVIGMLAIQLHAVDHSNVKYIGIESENLKILAVKVVKEIKTRDGIIKIGNRNNKLVEVNIETRTKSLGLTIINPGSFSAICKYRKAYRLIQSRAVGLKPVVKGKIIELLISAADANMNIESDKAGEKISCYIYFEIPKEVKEFQIQIPSLIPGSATIK